MLSKASIIVLKKLNTVDSISDDELSLIIKNSEDVLQSLVDSKYINRSFLPKSLYMTEFRYSISEKGRAYLEQRPKAWFITYYPHILSTISLIISLLVAALK